MSNLFNLKFRTFNFLKEVAHVIAVYNIVVWALNTSKQIGFDVMLSQYTLTLIMSLALTLALSSLGSSAGFLLHRITEY